MTRAFCALAFLFLRCVPLTAADAITIDDLSVGTTLMGPDYTVVDMKGKVVLLNLWGIDDLNVLSRMALFDTLYDKYKEEGFYIATINIHRDSPEEARNALVGKAVSHQVTLNGDLRAANKANNFERTELLGHDGAVLDENLNNQLDRLEMLIRAALVKKHAATIGAGPYKKLASVAAQAKVGKDFSVVLKALEKSKNSKDAAEAAEATMMFDAIVAEGQLRLTDALRMRNYDITDCLARLVNLSKYYAGCDIGTKAQQEGDELRKDPKTKDELAANAMYIELRKLENRLRPPQKGSSVKSDNFKKLNAEALQRLIAGFKALTQKYPDTSAARKATTLAESYQ